MSVKKGSKSSPYSGIVKIRNRALKKIRKEFPGLLNSGAIILANIIVSEILKQILVDVKRIPKKSI